MTSIHYHKKKREKKDWHGLIYQLEFFFLPSSSSSQSFHLARNAKNESCLQCAVVENHHDVTRNCLDVDRLGRSFIEQKNIYKIHKSLFFPSLSLSFIFILIFLFYCAAVVMSFSTVSFHENSCTRKEHN